MNTKTEMENKLDETFSIVTKTKFNNKVANSMLDSGAGPSVMDLRTFESLGISSKITKMKDDDDVLRDASDNPMDILGTANVNVQICGTIPLKLCCFPTLHNEFDQGSITTPVTSSS